MSNHDKNAVMLPRSAVILPGLAEQVSHPDITVKDAQLNIVVGSAFEPGTEIARVWMNPPLAHPNNCIARWMITGAVTFFETSEFNARYHESMPARSGTIGDIGDLVDLVGEILALADVYPLTTD